MERITIKDRNVLNTLLISLGSLLLAVELLSVTIVIFSFIPIKLNEFIRTLLPLYWDQVRPERDMLFYALFILYSVLIQLAVMFVLRKRLDRPELTRNLRGLLLLEIAVVALEIMAAFKIVIFNSPIWARYFLYGAFGLSALSKIFYPELRKIFAKLHVLLQQPVFDRRWILGMDIGLPVVLFILLWTPNVTNVLAHVFAWDYFFHLDFFVMSPGWAHLKGGLLNIDTNSNYNIFIPILWSHIAQALGGFDHAHMIQAFVLGSIIYYIGVYVLVRSWTKSVMLAAFAALLSAKLQLFHWGIWPLVWRYPSATAIRHFFDLAVFFAILRHSQTGERKMLWLASAACGFVLAYSFEVGVYATLGFAAYLGFLLINSETRPFIFKKFSDLRIISLWLFLPLVIGILLLWLLQGSSVVSSAFWSNMMEFSRLFLNGWAALPVTDGLKDKQYFAFIMGFVIPAVYVLTSMLVAALCIRRQMPWANVFVIFFCVYGLGLFHYFIYRSGVTSYDAVIIPFVLVIVFWIHTLSVLLKPYLRRLVYLGLVGGTLLALMTSYLFTFYPNALNLGRFDYMPEVNAYNQAMDMKSDADFIASHTQASEHVALISSMETELLMRADRKPFFYFFPLIHSLPLSSPDFKATDLLTLDRLQRTLTQMESQKPERIFVEKKLIQGKLPKEYYEHFQTLTILLKYVQTHYDGEDEGQYLMSLKRKQ